MTARQTQAVSCAHLDMCCASSGSRASRFPPWLVESEGMRVGWQARVRQCVWPLNAFPGSSSDSQLSQEQSLLCQ